MKFSLRPLLTVVAVLLLVQSASRVVANDIDIVEGDKLRVYDGVGSLGGGVFEIKPIGGSDFTPFQTFCLQRTESIDFASKGFIVADISSHTDDFDYLSPKTAYLYTQFRLGTSGDLDELGFAFTGSAAQNWANALQSVIWHLEQEPGYASLNSLPNAYKSLAWKLYNKATAVGWTDLGLVRVASLVYATSRSGHKKGDKAQDILILLPEPASIAFWSTSAVIGGFVCFVRRRRTNVDLV